MLRLPFHYPLPMEWFIEFLKSDKCDQREEHLCSDKEHFQCILCIADNYCSRSTSAVHKLHIIAAFGL